MRHTFIRTVHTAGPVGPTLAAVRHRSNRAEVLSGERQRPQCAYAGEVTLVQQSSVNVGHQAVSSTISKDHRTGKHHAGHAFRRQHRLIQTRMWLRFVVWHSRPLVQSRWELSHRCLSQAARKSSANTVHFNAWVYVNKNWKSLSVILGG